MKDFGVWLSDLTDKLGGASEAPPSPHTKLVLYSVTGEALSTLYYPVEFITFVAKSPRVEFKLNSSGFLDHVLCLEKTIEEPDKEYFCGSFQMPYPRLHAEIGDIVQCQFTYGS